MAGVAPENVATRHRLVEVPRVSVPRSYNAPDLLGPKA